MHQKTDSALQEARQALAHQEQRESRYLQSINDEALRFAANCVLGKSALIPLAVICDQIGQAAYKTEPSAHRKWCTYYESARAAVRAAKAAIREGHLICREQGSGMPLDLSAWCRQDETGEPICEFMPHVRAMVHTDDARRWLESIGAQVPTILQIEINSGKQSAARNNLDQATWPPPSTQRAPRRTSKDGPRQTVLRKAIFSILETHKPEKAAALEAVKSAIECGDIPSGDKVTWKEKGGAKFACWETVKGTPQESDIEAINRAIKAYYEQR